MTNSEILWLSGCLGVYGETDIVKLSRAVEVFGKDRQLFYLDPKREKAREALERVCGRPQ